jgi:OOP family OmpA-OmpF porin
MFLPRKAHELTLENKMKLVRAAGALSLAGFAAVSGPAAAADDGWYLGFGIGQSREQNHHDRITQQLQGSGLTTNSIDDDSTDTAWKLLGGWKFNRNFAVEASYFNLGEFGFTAHTTPPGTFTGRIKLQGFGVDGVGILPISQSFSAFGKLGLQYAKAEDTFSGTGAVTVSNPSPSKSAAGYKVGLGLQYDFTPALGLRGEWENYRVDDAVGNKGNINTLMVGLVYTFGGKAAPRAAAAPPPVVAIAPASVAEPVLVIVPIVAKTEQYCSILDIQFEINQKTVQRESEEKINKVAIFMKKYPATTAVIEGHTDEVGIPADNMKLSERRAESVVTYLVDKGGIARSRLKSVGYGETRPIGDNKTEEGRRLNRRINAIIACATDIEGIEVAPERITMAMEMEFDANRAELRPQYRPQLQKVVNFMKANPRVTASVEGHTSNQQGTAAQSMQLSQERAQSVVNAMAEMGIDRKRLFAEGFGTTRRFAYNTSAEGRQENRRVNIILDFPKQ